MYFFEVWYQFAKHVTERICQERVNGVCNSVLAPKRLQVLLMEAQATLEQTLPMETPSKYSRPRQPMMKP